METLSPAPDQPQCTVERLVRGSGSLLKLCGTIDQTFDSMSFSQQSVGTTILDLDGVTRITSFGVREWNKAIQLLNAAYLGFVNVRPAMVTQFNVVAGVSGNGQIASMYVPFICPFCDSAFEILYDLRKDFAKLEQLDAHPPPCPSCAKPSELDELPMVYFNFINRQGPPTPPNDFDMVLEGTASTAPANSTSQERVQQEVEGSETYLWLNGPLDAGLGLRRVVDSLEGTVVVVLHGVTEVEVGAGAQIAKLLKYDGGPLFFARVPPAVRAVLSAAGASARIGSWWVSQTCPQCATSIDFELTLAGPRPACPKCQEPLVLTTRHVALERELTTLPASVTAALAGRAGPRKAVGRGSFLSRFEVLRKIGSGGMGEVYLARMKGLGGFEKRVALKRILAGVAKAPNGVEMFLSEARLAARLSHRNIVQIFDVGHERGEFYIALEYVDGLDLRSIYDLCKQTNQLVPAAIAMQLIADIAAGLGAAHGHVEPDGTSHVIVHRDVSPHNILISASGEAKITDFGIAKMESDADATPASVTKGKLSYLAPEQVRREGPRAGLEPRSDIFSLGVVLYQTLTLSHPFSSANAYDTLKAVLEKPITSVSEQREPLPLIDAIIARATAKDLATRYATAEAMRADLLAAIGSPAPDVAAWLRPLLKLRAPTVGQQPTVWSSETSSRDEELTKARSFTKT